MVYVSYMSDTCKNDNILNVYFGNGTKCQRVQKTKLISEDVNVTLMRPEAV